MAGAGMVFVSTPIRPPGDRGIGVRACLRRKSLRDRMPCKPGTLPTAKRRLRYLKRVPAPRADIIIPDIPGFRRAPASHRAMRAAGAFPARAPFTPQARRAGLRQAPVPSAKGNSLTAMRPIPAAPLSGSVKASTPNRASVGSRPACGLNRTVSFRQRSSSPPNLCQGLAARNRNLGRTQP
jgi:hypothetical protein